MAAFAATARSATERWPALDAAALARAARERARELWYAAPTHPWCRRIGMSSWEGLWCRFEGEGPDCRALRRWAPEYRREAWRRALADQGVEDPALAAELGERFGVERRAQLAPFPEAAAALRALAGSWPLALVTNGASCLQREKLAASGLAELFEVVAISAEVGAAKPQRAAFAAALAQLGAEPGDAVMVGDSLERDVEGARAAGLAAVWVNRAGAPAPPGVRHVASLAELPAALG